MDKMKSFIKRQKNEFISLQRQTMLKQIAVNDRSATNVDLGKETDAEFLEEVCEALQSNTNVLRFSVKGADLNESSGIRAIAELITRTTRLTSLRLTQTNLSDDDATPLFGAMSRNTTIRQLSLDSNYLFSAEGIVLMLQHNATIEDLDLSGNRFFDDALFDIAEAMKSASSLRSLNLGGNGVSDHAGMKFATVIEKHLADLPGLHTLELGKDASTTPETKRYLGTLLDSRPKPSKLAALTSQLTRNDGLPAASTDAIDDLPPQQPAPTEEQPVAPAEENSNGGSPAKQQPAPVVDVSAEASARIAQLERELGATKVSLLTVTEERNTLHQACQTLTTERNSARDDLEALNNTLSDLQEGVAAEMLTAKEEMQKQVHEERAKAAAAVEEMEAMKVETEQLKASTLELQAEAAAEMDAVAKHVDELRAQLDAAASELQTVATDRDRNAERVVEVERRLNTALQQLLELQVALDAALAAGLGGVSSTEDAEGESSAAVEGVLERADVGCMTTLSTIDLEDRRRRREQRKEQVRYQRLLQRDRKATMFDGSSPSSPSRSRAATAMPSSHNRNGSSDTTGSFVTIDGQDVDTTFSPMTKQDWKKDDDVSECGICEKKFSLTVRKHHCRRCGDVFCDSCCSKSKLHNNMRICGDCLRKRSMSTVSSFNTTATAA